MLLRQKNYLQMSSGGMQKINLFYEQALTDFFRLTFSELGISFIYNLALQQIA